MLKAHEVRLAIASVLYTQETANTFEIARMLDKINIE